MQQTADAALAARPLAVPPDARAPRHALARARATFALLVCARTLAHDGRAAAIPAAPVGRLTDLAAWPFTTRPPSALASGGCPPPRVMPHGCRSTRSARSRWTPCRRPTRGTRARQWRWRRSRYTLYTRLLRVNPADPHWPDRDRFVLSAGHACILQYSLHHLVGYDLTPRGSQAVPPVGLAHAGAPRARAHARHRGHHRAARAGLRQRRGHGDGRAFPRRALQPPGP